MQEKLELRMYSLVMHQLSGIQAGIQSGHANDEYANRYEDSEDYLHWRKCCKTVIILNGGSSNTLQNAMQKLSDNEVKYCPFNEPDLYNLPFACSFLVDERVWDKVKYPDMPEYYDLLKKFDDLNKEKKQLIDVFNSELAKDLFDKEKKLKEEAIPVFHTWSDMMGNPQNVFLREFLKGFQLHRG